MKVLWIAYAALGKAAELLEKKQTQSGTWIDASVNALTQLHEIELTVACISSNSDRVIDPNTGVVYKGIAEVQKKSGTKPSLSEIDVWKSVISLEKPDIIMIWGTEYANGLAVIEAAEKIPVLIFIQGVLGKIVRYPIGCLSMHEVLHTTGPINAVKFLHFKKHLRVQQKQCAIEAEMIKKCSGIITDNDWAISYYRTILPELRNYFFPLPINPFFINGERTPSEELSLFTIDGGNPAKGVYHLVKALAIVKKRYPHVKLYIPGRIPTGNPKILKESPYYAYLKKLIDKYDLGANVIFLGQLTSLQMREQLAKCSAFVMPSAIENHSSSLREAMYMGVPSISSLVGCVPEFTIDGKNALTYRYEEEEILASHIIKLLNDVQYAESLGSYGRKSVNEMFPQNDLGERMLKIYHEVLSNESIL